MSDLSDDLYLSPDEDSEESSPLRNSDEKIVEQLEKVDDLEDFKKSVGITGSSQGEEESSSQPQIEYKRPDKKFLSTSNLDKFNESFKKEAEFWKHVSDTSIDEEEFEREVTDILNKEKFKMFNESFEKQAQAWNNLSESLDEEKFEKHIEQEILQKPFEIFLQNDMDLFESLFQNGDNFWKKVKNCLSEEEFERLVQIYIESEDITWKRLTTEAFESITKPPTSRETVKVVTENTDEKAQDTKDLETSNLQDRKNKNPKEDKGERSPKRIREITDVTEEPKKKKTNFNSSANHKLNNKKMVEFDMFERQPQKCRKCPSLFKSSRELKVHMQIHEKVEDVKPFICDLCPKSFKVSNQLRLHKEFNHSVNRPLTCNFCNRPFKQFDVLQKHRRRHYA